MKLAPDDRDACRLAFAALAMHGLVASGRSGAWMEETTARYAVEQADALLAELEAPEQAE